MRTTLERDDVEVVAINDPFISADYMAYMFKYDTVHGRLPGTAAAAHDQECKPDTTCPDVLLVNGRTVRVFNSKDPAQIPWGEVGADFVIESTGVFTDVAKSSGVLPAQHSHRRYLTSPLFS
jgi:glyceraldehyde 3-phosphate dehydrogenase